MRAWMRLLVGRAARATRCITGRAAAEPDWASLSEEAQEKLLHVITDPDPQERYTAWVVQITDPLLRGTDLHTQLIGPYYNPASADAARRRLTQDLGPVSRGGPAIAVRVKGVATTA